MVLISHTVISGLFRNEDAIFGVLIVVGVLLVTLFVVGWIMTVRRGSNREWPFR
jgi:hypothetical protein